ncbi:MAG: hypothetical protein NZ658_07205, partial [Pirellulales bacterium]|nr:hypothetical protein [Pirellulales bacterium]
MGGGWSVIWRFHHGGGGSGGHHRSEDSLSPWTGGGRSSAAVAGFHGLPLPLAIRGPLRATAARLREESRNVFVCVSTECLPDMPLAAAMERLAE